jgi:hypothetical protein
VKPEPRSQRWWGNCWGEDAWVHIWNRGLSLVNDVRPSEQCEYISAMEVRMQVWEAEHKVGGFCASNWRISQSLELDPYH